MKAFFKNLEKNRSTIFGISNIVDSKYMAQKAFLDRSIYKFLKEKVITQALVDNIAYKLDFSQAEVQDNTVLEESIITLLKLFTIELKEK